MIFRLAIFAFFLVLAYMSLKPLIQPVKQAKAIDFKNMLGVNVFEWNFLQDPRNAGDGSRIYEPKMELIRSFGGIRHYLDWKKIEPEKGKYTFNPTADGGWNLDTMYQRCEKDGIDILVCLKTCPDWILKTYPENSRDVENVPMPYGSDKMKPGSYIDQARAAFQFAARYGSNKNIGASLVSVSSIPRWNGDQINQLKTGMNLVKYIECDNERDKWWKGDKAHQSPGEYAANLSAFYDGDKGKLGKGVGVKNADPRMKVVMAGLAATDLKYVTGMIDWCKKNRGLKKDGSVDLCFDVINFHLYANDHKSNLHDQRTVGIAPELSEAGEVADEFVKLGNIHHLPVWVTEAGYDINPKSPQRAIAIGGKSALITQADWTARTCLLYARHGIQKLFFYELYDDHLESTTQYSSSGLVTNELARRPAANYIRQLNRLLGEFHYQRTLSQSPLVDEYICRDKVIYALVMPSQKGKTGSYSLALKSNTAIVYQLSASSAAPAVLTKAIKNNHLIIPVTETPVFVEEEHK